jgi:hypothetical protein
MGTKAYRPINVMERTDWTGDSNSDSWDRFLSVMDSCVDEDLRRMVGGTAITPTKEFCLADELVSENNPEILRRFVYF